MVPILRLLGRFELETGDGQPLAISGARAQLLLARLAMAPGKGLDRAVLSAMFWADRAEAQARASLRQTIWTLRQGLKDFPDALVASGECLRLDLEVIGCDVADFERLAVSKVAPDLEAALRLYRGEFLEGFDLVSLAPDTDFLPERHRLRDLGLKVAAKLAGLHAQASVWEDVVRVARTGLAIDNFDEALHAWLIEGLHRMGRKREARDQDLAFRNLMRAELGVTLAPQPTPATGARRGTFGDHRVATPHRPKWPVYAGGLVVAAFLIAATLVQLRPEPDAVATAPADQNTGLPSQNLEAYDQYLRAEAARLDASKDGKLRDVMAEFRKAFMLDPNFADAYAGYALVAVDLWQRSLDLGAPSLDSRTEAYDAAGRALAIDPGNARALVVLSRIQAQDGAQDSALASARSAVTAEPDSAEAHANLALILSRNGQAFKARAELTRLRQLDPFPRPEWLLIFGEVAFAEGRYYNAIADLVAAWPELPDNPLLLEHLTAALAIQGQLVQAQMVRDKLLTLLPEANLYLLLEHYSPLRRAEQNQRLLDGLRRAGLPVWPQGVGLAEADRLTGTDLAALLGAVPGSRDQYLRGQYLRGNELCRIEQGRSVCGAIYRAPPGRDVDYVFVAPTELRFFSVPPK